MLESRRQMVERGRMFGVPTYRWLPAKSKLTVNYCAFVTEAPTMPTSVLWDGIEDVQLS